ncbi:MAG: pilus assembly protein N-terminal domain-containing protein [Paracoccaceae bacterium]
MNEQKVSFFGALIAALLCSGGVAAQDLNYKSVASQPCRTTTERPGILFGGHYNTIFAPEDLEVVHISNWNRTVTVDSTVANDEITVYPSLRYGNQILVYSSESAQVRQRTSIAFLDQDGETLGSCFVDVVSLDMTVHDFSKTRLGFCEFGERAGVLQLTVGTARVLDLPESYSEVATSPRSVLDHSTLFGARQVELTGKSEGPATFVWNGYDAGDGVLKGVCPVIVSDGA